MTGFRRAIWRGVLVLLVAACIVFLVILLAGIITYYADRYL